MTSMTSLAAWAASWAPAVEAWSGKPAPPSSPLMRFIEASWDGLMATTGQQALFFVFALFAVLSAFMTITRRNPVVAAVWLVGSFFAVAVCYVLMAATFLAALQVLVYAGAMMVLFVFVVMVLDVDDRGEAEHRKPSRVGKIGFYGLTVLLIGFVSWLLLGTLARQFSTPGREITESFGTANAVGRELFGPYLFAFEAVSLLLLAAVVGAVVVARSRRERAKEAAAAGLSEAELHVAGLGAIDDDDELAGRDLSDAQVRRPNPAMDFGAPSAGGHHGGN